MAENGTLTTAPGAEVARTHEDTRAPEQFIEPRVDIYENEEGLTLLADMPGVTKDDLSIEVEDGVLTIQGKAHPAEQGASIYREFGLTNFYRQFRLSKQVDPARITAEFKHGVLTLKVPRAEQAKPKQIPVTVG